MHASGLFLTHADSLSLSLALRKTAFLRPFHLSTAGVAYCWGDNTYVQQGTTSGGLNSLVPAKVAGQP